MNTATINAPDPYASRTSDRVELTDRIDPVLWSESPGALSEAQTQQYDRDGFLFLPELFSKSEVQALLEESSELTSQWPQNRPGLVREPDSRVVRSAFRLHAFSERFHEFFRDPRLVDPALQLLGSDFYLHQSRINYKPALDGQQFFWHSDFETWHVEDGMPRMRAISISVFLTESHEFNGPLMLIPGSHKTYVRCAGETPENHYEQSLRRQEFGVPDRHALEKLVQGGGIVAPTGPAGSVVLFECNTMHGSAGNLSPTPRINLFAVYNSLQNLLTDPFCDRPPRPDYLAERSPETIIRGKSAPA